MFIQPIINIRQNTYKTNFKAKTPDLSQLFRNTHLEKQLEQINKNKETKEIFAGLTALAGAIITEIAIFTEENKQAKQFFGQLINNLGINTNTEDLKQTEKTTKKVNNHHIDNSPERKLYLKITSYFPNLNNKYQQLLKTELKEPQNAENELSLNVLESVFKFMSEDNRLMEMKHYLKLLDDYADNLDDITKNIASTIKNGNSIMYYLVLLNNGKLTKDDIKKWAQVNQFSCDDFMILKKLDKDALIRISNLKKENPDFSIKQLKEMNDITQGQTYAFKLDFNKKMSLAEKLKTVSAVHTAIYGDIYLKENKEDSSIEYLEKDVQREMLDNILKDRRMESVFNFARFIDPDAFNAINLSSEDVKFMAKEDSRYNVIKDICSKIILGLDYTNPNLIEFCEVLNNNDIFGDIAKTRHSRIRFLSRFVLKNNPKPKEGLEKACTEKANLLIQALDNNLSKCNYFCFKHTRGTAPQFYLKAPALGNFIKITLNDNGTIHTIYEDANKEIQIENIKKEAD